MSCMDEFSIQSLLFVALNDILITFWALKYGFLFNVRDNKTLMIFHSWHMHLSYVIFLDQVAYLRMWKLLKSALVSLWDVVINQLEGFSRYIGYEMSKTSLQNLLTEWYFDDPN